MEPLAINKHGRTLVIFIPDYSIIDIHIYVDIYARYPKIMYRFIILKYIFQELFAKASLS